MYFALIARDKPDHIQLRKDTRPAHLDYLNALRDKGTVKLAGPFLDANGNAEGSLVVIEAASMEEADAIAAADPYARAGLFAQVEIRPWSWVVNPPEEK